MTAVRGATLQLASFEHTPRVADASDAQDGKVTLRRAAARRVDA
jgi:hypothetical protein